MLCPEKNEMVVTVKVIEVVSRVTVLVDISEEQTVRQLKSLLEGKGHGPVHRQRLAHAGKLLDDEATILECGVASIPTVVLSLRPAAIADPTIGAMSQAVRNQSDAPSVTEYLNQVPAAPVNNEQRDEEVDEDANIPTCRICHGAFDSHSSLPQEIAQILLWQEVIKMTNLDGYFHLVAVGSATCPGAHCTAVSPISDLSECMCVPPVSQTKQRRG